MSSANAAFCDNFEDGDHAGWLLSTTGGIGSTGVELYNGSKMAYVEHTGRYQHALSRDFSYSSSEPLSFDMQAVAISNQGLRASSGVTISFLNAFNVELGSISLCNDTHPGELVAPSYAIDQLQHHYDASLAEFAAMAGLKQTDDPKKISLSFWAWGDTKPAIAGYHHSYAYVHFDNVCVGGNANPVPVPAAVWLFGSGLIGLLGIRRKFQE